MIEQYTGISIDYFIIGLAAAVIILLLFLIILAVKFSGLKKKYLHFMSGESGKSLEKLLVYRFDQIDELIESNNKNERNIETIYSKMRLSIDKYGLVKYDALQEMGGKLSYSLALLDNGNNGFIINNVHSRDGSYSYIKEVIDGNVIANLSPEEKEALDLAVSGKGR